ncbi:hypothetical protein CHUAL_000479 [Chamberlinius hualienensis]
MKSLEVLVLLISIINLAKASVDLNEVSALNFLNDYDVSASEYCRQSAIANWNYNTNITQENQKLMIDADRQFAKFAKEAWENFTKYDWNNFTNELTKRQFKLGSILGTAALPDEKYAQLKGNTSKMEEIYSTTKVCKFNDSSSCHLNLDPELTQLFLDSRNYNELLDAWKQWHDKVGRPIKPYYVNYVKLSNEGAKLNGMNDLGEFWRYPYEDNQFEAHLASLWEQLKPFYMQLHAYVRRKLVAIYGEGYVSSTGPIPAHLLGNMWAQEWTALYNDTKPFDVVENDDSTANMKAQNYTVDRMFRMSEDFFTSIGLEPMTESFWNNSMLTRPTDREVVCHASAWDFCDGQDFRIKMCTEIRLEDLITVHHEMGHIQYYQQYKNQSYLFRDGANPGFHEAIGDVLALSVSTNKHLSLFNLSDFANDTSNADINFLYNMALKKLAFLPFGYVLDYWRWRVFREEIPQSKWNEEWWKMRRDYQGIESAVTRTEEDFDPAAKYHVPANVPYDRYFVATIIQFQFHKSLCELADEYNATDPSKPLHHCDIYGNEVAGKRFSEAMQSGSSKPWPQVMQLLVGKSDMDAAPMMDYFKPLYDFLVSDNIKHEAKIGWE